MGFNSGFKGLTSFNERFFKNTQITEFIEICSEGAELFHADGRRTDDVTGLMDAFRSFAKAP